MSESVHVCQIINALGHGGAEQLLVDLTEAMEQATMTVVSLDSEDALTPSLQEAGARVIHLDETVRFDPRTFVSTRRILSEDDFDIVHTHLPYAQTVGRIAARAAGQDVLVSTQHNVPSNYHPVVRKTEQITRRLEDVTIAVSQGVERAFTGTSHEPSVFGDSWCTIYNGIHIERFRNGVVAADRQNEFDIDDETTVFLTVGRYAPEKSQTELIKAFAEADLPDAVLLLVGHGPLETALQDTATKHGIGEQVDVTGRVPAVEPYYAVADVFVNSSRTEGHPVTLLEAMAAELPVIAPDIPGVDEIVVGGETGHLYPYGETDQLASLLTEYAGNTTDALGRAGYERAKSLFDIDSMAQSYLALYRSLISD